MYCNQLRHRWPGHPGTFRTLGAAADARRECRGRGRGTGTRGETREATARERGRAGCDAQEGSTGCANAGGRGGKGQGRPPKMGAGRFRPFRGQERPLKRARQRRQVTRTFAAAYAHPKKEKAQISRGPPRRT
jgi:hypothetical protein